MIPFQVDQPPAMVRAADLILQHQMEDGALVMGTQNGPPFGIVPYFSNFAALGLTATYRETGKREYLAAAQRWAEWYHGHMNADGTVNDYRGVPGAWESTGDYDSTDSYAGTYLELLQALLRAGVERDWLEARRPSLPRALNAIRLTLQPNGLTLAKPGWPMMYTMDNTETARGLHALEEVANALEEEALATEAGTLARAMAEAVERELWDEELECYRVGIQLDGGKTHGLRTWYPDVMASLMAIAWLPPHPRHRPLLERLKERFPAYIPVAVRRERDLDQLVWWGLAAQGAQDRELWASIAERLMNFDAQVTSWHNVGLLGHVCCLLAEGKGAK